MVTKQTNQRSYFELVDHNAFQLIIFFVLLAGGCCFIYILLLPLLHSMFEFFLSADVHNSKEFVSKMLEDPKIKRETSYLFAWAIDINPNTPSETRYWFYPLISFSIPSILLGIAFAVIVSALMPKKIGFVRQKIEREIIGVLDKISMIKYGFHSDNAINELIEEFSVADLRDLNNFSDAYGVPLDDLRILNKSIRWQNGSFFYQFIHVNHGIRMYMRFYFTEQYGNGVLGFVYIGAAVLIMIIGLRGLKFIPPTEPSLVFFALGLEFSLLIIYALTLMYSKRDEEVSRAKPASSQDSLLLSNEFASSQEVENLLRVFIKTKKKK